MRSQALGKNTSGVEIQNISCDGIWLYASGREYFLPYDEYPWFRSATVDDILNVALINGCHLEWPNLDVDLEIESLDHPEEYPLTYS